MTSKPASRKPTQTAQSREDRLKAALKANLARRKSQARAKAGQEAEAVKTTGPNKDS